MASIRRNPYVPDPHIAKGLENIASMFAPPSAQDLAAGAATQAKQAEAARQAEAWKVYNDPNTAPEVRERVGIAGQFFNPSQSFTAVGMNNATQRYGYDRTYQASTENNVRDNSRALQTNAADNERAVTTSMLQPVAAGATRFVPPDVASMFKVDPTQIGVIETKPGETATLPDGRTIAGTPVPLTTDQIVAATLAEQPMADRRAVAMKDIKPTEIMRDGRRVYANAADAAGNEVPVDPTKETLTNAVDANGRVLGAAVNRNGQLVEPTTGKPYPAGTGVASLSVQAQTPGGLGSKSTEDQRKAAYAYRMTNEATSSILAGFDAPDGAGLPTKGDEALRGLASVSPVFAKGMVQNQMSPQGQNFLQDVKTALPMQLLTQSGMGVTEGEYDRKMQELVPIRGEDPGVTAKKRRQFAAYREAIKRMAGPALEEDERANAPVSSQAGAAGAPGAVVSVQTPEEANKLPPGTRFRRPDGKEFIR
ncbi:hypothetical protein GCM10007036_16580 [Alsobacter metallidurans]|uniref:Uncharacterized protein n=1 Tax=Alsobacter metallidurans TaxID=340221 RepID=A0A917I5A5_9HYPH|nr:hypothetical protein [Alsobacter metallidurans]GGH16136.1 hypothetical protein GCM10007036_16580 [Alsobacter metallidurans]